MILNFMETRARKNLDEKCELKGKFVLKFEANNHNIWMYGYD